ARTWRTRRICARRAAPRACPQRSGYRSADHLHHAEGRRASARGTRQGCCESGGAEHGLDLELDGDLVTDDDAAAVHRHLDVDAELVAVDLGLGGEAGARAAEGVRAEAVELKVEDDRAGDALDRQLALDGPVGRSE